MTTNASYGVMSVTNTLESQGVRAGMRTVAVRFSGCNLWDGHPLHRHAGSAACAHWCDADFYKGEVLRIPELLVRMNAAWPRELNVPKARWCVLTGGEPLLQVNDFLLECLHAEGWRVAVETNGTVAHPSLVPGAWREGKQIFEHVVVSPKRGAKLVVTAAHELRVVVPGGGAGAFDGGWTDAELNALEGQGTWGAIYVVPQDIPVSDKHVTLTVLKGDPVSPENPTFDEVLGDRYAAHVARAVDVVMDRPSWRLAPEMRKLVGLP